MDVKSFHIPEKLNYSFQFESKNEIQNFEHRTEKWNVE